MIYTTKPYDHQKEALELAYPNVAFALFMEMGTGKSKIIVDEIVNLIEEDKINCAIVVAPNNVHINWKSEFIKHGPPDYDKWAIQIWRSGQSAEKREKETKDIIASGKCLIFLINIEALSAASGTEYLRRILAARRKSYMVIDESHKIKTPGAARTKNVIALGAFAYIRRIATGTEAEEGIENLYSQFKFLHNEILGHRTFASFRSMYCKMGGYEFREIIGYQNKDILANRIAPYVYQKRKKDCLDLPDKVYVTHEIDMTKEQERIYNQLEEELLLVLENGELVDATEAMTRIMRLQQVLCGHINSSNNPNASEFIPSNRADLASEIVQEDSGKTLIFCRFIKDVELVVTNLAKNNIGSIGLSSMVNIRNRMSEIDRWRQEDHLKALVMTTATGGVGLTLNEANNVIFYSNSWSGTDRKQAEDRCHRIGQTEKVTYHDIIVRKSIDHKLLRALRSKDQQSIEFRNLIDIVRFLKEDI